MNIDPSNANTAAGACLGLVPSDFGSPNLTIPCDWSNQRQLFSTYGVYLIGQPVVPVEFVEFGDMIAPRVNLPVWWTVNLWGREIPRTGFPAPDEATPLPQGEIMTNGCRGTHIKARIYTENNISADSFDVDIGDATRFSVLANSLRVTLLAPAQTFEIGSASQAEHVVDDGSMVLNAIVGASAYPCNSPLGSPKVTLTEIRVVGVPGTRRFCIPPRARRLTVYNTEPGEIWNWTQFRPTVGPFDVTSNPYNLGNFIPAVAGAPREGMVDAALVPGQASHYRTPDPATVAPGVRTLVWELGL